MLRVGRSSPSTGRAQLVAILVAGVACASTEASSPPPVDLTEEGPAALLEYWTPVELVRPKFNMFDSTVLQEGEVIYHYTIRSDGTVGDVDLVRSSTSKSFRKAVRRAIRQWTYTPAPMNESRTPVRVSTRMSVDTCTGSAAKCGSEWRP